MCLPASFATSRSGRRQKKELGTRNWNCSKCWISRLNTSSCWDLTEIDFISIRQDSTTTASLLSNGEAAIFAGFFTRMIGSIWPTEVKLSSQPNLQTRSKRVYEDTTGLIAGLFFGATRFGMHR